MEKNLNLENWNFIFAVPCNVVESYINECTFIQLKVLLWILKNKNLNFINMCNNLLISKTEAYTALNFWIELGILPEKFNICCKNSKLMENKEKSPMNVKYDKPDLYHVGERIKKSDDVSFLIREAQIILGRPISSVDSTILLMLHDNEGLPIDVILMIIQYAVTIGKSSIRYIETIGHEWAKNGIDSIEKAEKKINYLDSTYKKWRNFSTLIGIEHRVPTLTEETMILKWYEKWKFKDTLIKHAYDICIDAKGKYNIRYIDGILKKWNLNCITEIDEIKKIENKYKDNKSKFQNETFDIKEYEGLNIFGNY